jgi:BlaI family transcriptional regulator, penicillinase repressor
MPRKKSDILGGREAEIMGILWRLGPSSAEAIRALMRGDPHDSSVRTILRVLEEKGHVTHTTRGRTYIYRSRARQATAQRKAVQVLLSRLFGGSAENLVLRLLEDEEISPGELRDLAESLERNGRRDA